MARINILLIVSFVLVMALYFVFFNKDYSTYGTGNKENQPNK